MLRWSGLPHIWPQLFPSTQVQISYSLIKLLFHKRNSSGAAGFLKWCGALLRNIGNKEKTQRNVPEYCNRHQNWFENFKFRKTACWISKNKSLDQGYTNLGVMSPWRLNFVRQLQTWNSLHVILLVPNILKWQPHFLKISTDIPTTESE